MKYLFILLLLGLAAMGGLSLYSLITPGDIGLTDGRLNNCPNSDNCVSSQAANPDRQVPPIVMSGPVPEVMDRLGSAVEAMGGEVTEFHDNYLHAVFTSRIWRFRDDLELLYDETDGAVHVRSASRVGYSDLGANRRRVEALRRQLGQH